MKKFFALALLLTITLVSFAQDDLLKELNSQEEKENVPVVGTFNGTRLINGHSIETKNRGALEFIITHRFGRINSGGFNLWGLDESYIRIGLEYGITDKLGVGFGRSSFDKSFDYYVKYKVLEQKDGVPVTISALGTAAYKAVLNQVDPSLKTGEKMSYVGQVLIARKFSSRVSLQIMPTFLHQATTFEDESIATKNLISLGMGGRVKLTKSMAILGEYYLRMNEKDDNPFHDSMGLGIEFETGGHVFQLIFTNSNGMIERAFMAETADDFFDGGIHFGFNITRTFQLSRNK